MKVSLSVLFFGYCVAGKAKLMIGSPEYHDSWVEKITITSSYKTYLSEIETREVDHGRRPVIGILTEPLRGDIGEAQGSSYVPKAHVQFLEQSGVRVVPIDFRLSHAERDELYNKLNGVYVPGDSHESVTS